jgi:hypothetical protein
LRQTLKLIEKVMEPEEEEDGDFFVDSREGEDE